MTPKFLFLKKNKKQLEFGIRRCICTRSLPYHNHCETRRHILLRGLRQTLCEAHSLAREPRVCVRDILPTSYRINWSLNHFFLSALISKIKGLAEFIVYQLPSLEILTGKTVHLKSQKTEFQNVCTRKRKKKKRVMIKVIN